MVSCEYNNCANHDKFSYNNLMTIDSELIITTIYQTSQLGRSHNRETINLQPNVEPFTPCNYNLDAEPTFMRAQNAQFTWA